jgi:hypothetical protein
MDDLVTWLRAQWDDDERVARAAQPGPWTMRENSTPWTDIDAADGTVTSSYEGDVIAVSDAEHIVRWDPARVLAEVDAKRRILDCFVEDMAMKTSSPEGRDWVEGYAAEAAHRVCLLALPMAGRDGYDESWRP